MKILPVLVLFLLLFKKLDAQEVLPVPSSIQVAYNKGTRDITGKPGLKFWQNTSNYNLKIDFSPTTREIKGIVDVTYFNYSPDTLKELWFKLYPNLYKKDIEKNVKVSDRDISKGVIISTFKVDGIIKDITSLRIEGTNMHTQIKGLMPGDSIRLHFVYSYLLNETSHVRTGKVDDGAYFLAYFFPRVAVYDDLDGWNKLPYKGLEEFYNDFDNFKVEVTVPTNYVVWATGNLLNADQVLDKRIKQRLINAEKSDKVINVIDSNDLKIGRITKNRLFNTWKFNAKNVIDFAFATSNHYVWQSNSLIVDSITNRRARVDAVFNKNHKDYYEWVDFTQKTVHAMSFKFPKWPFPYSHITVFDGLGEMEYPMMVNANWVKDRDYAIGLVDHEVFHTMFPFYVGTNESKYAWMDEGWAAMGEWIISTIIDSTVIDNYGIKDYGSFSGSNSEKAVSTPSYLLDYQNYSFNSYTKSGLAYLYLKDYLGDELFTKALKYYINEWKGKHPMPFDFFNCMRIGSGKNLDWYWKRWFFEDGVVDMAIKNVERDTEGYIIEIENKSIKPLPVDLTLTYLDGTIERLHQNIGIWEHNNRFNRVKIKTIKELKKVELGSAYVPDKNNADNTYTLKQRHSSNK